MFVSLFCNRVSLYFLPVLDLNMWTRLSLKSQRSTCLSLLSSGVKGVYNPSQAKYANFVNTLK